MNLVLLKGYPDKIGRRQAFVGTGVGPASYSQTTRDVVNIPQFQNYIDVLHGAVTVSGTYTVQAIPSSVGPRATWKLRWIVFATGAEVANGVNLSAESVVLGGLGGTY
jgi:hypothetical protein